LPPTLAQYRPLLNAIRVPVRCVAILSAVLGQKARDVCVGVRLIGSKEGARCLTTFMYFLRGDEIYAGQQGRCQFKIRPI
jgi:hypothetical protein